MPGIIPPTSQLDWLSSTTAMIVLFWSRATRDLLKSFGWGIAALHRLHPATKLPSLRRAPHRICWYRGTKPGLSQASARIGHRIGSCSASPEAFEFGLGKFDRLLNRFALLRADGNHFADRALGSHLRSDTRRRGISREEGRYIMTWRVIIKRSRGGLFLSPGPEIAQLFVGWNIDAVAPGDELLDRGAGRQMGKQTLGRGFVNREIPEPPKAEIARVEAASW